MPTLHRDVSGQSAETTPLPNAARTLEGAQPGTSATPSLGRSPQTPSLAPQLLRARRLPHPSPTARPPRPGCSADFSALVSPSGLLTWVSRSRRHGTDGTVAAPPSVGGAAATELGEGREEPLHRSDTLPPPPLPRNPRWRTPTPPPSCGRRHAPKHAPRGGRGQAAAGLLGKLTSRNTKSTEGRAKD